MLTAACDNSALLWQISADAEPLADGGTDKQGIDDRERSQPPMAWISMLSGQVCCGRMARSPSRWPMVRGDGTDPIIGSRNRSPLGKARAALPRLDRPCGRLQSRRPMLRDRE